MHKRVYYTHTSWNSSNDFCGVKTFNKLIIWKREEHGEDQHIGLVKYTHKIWVTAGDGRYKLIMTLTEDTAERVNRRSELEQKSGDKCRGEEEKEPKPRHRRLHSCLEVLSVSLSCQFGTFLEAWNLARSQHCSRSFLFCSVGILSRTKNRHWLGNSLKLCFILTMETSSLFPRSLRPLLSSQLSHLHFCDWHISWAPTPGMPSWHGSGSGRVCSASWWLHFCPGQHHSPHCRRRNSLVFIAGWITLRVIAWHCDNPPWMSLATKNKRIIFHIFKQTKTHGNTWQMTSV